MLRSTRLLCSGMSCGRLGFRLVTVSERRRLGSQSPFPSPLTLVTLVLCAAMLVSCHGNPLGLRQQNATLILSEYRTKPLQLLTNGRVDLTVHECTRLAIENSLELQVAQWEEQLRSKLAASTHMRMLPHVAGQYELSQRDRLPFSYSDVLGREGTPPGGEGTGVTNFSTGREHNARRGQFEVKWSPMDAAIARYISHVKGNETQLARYQRVRVAQQLLAVVTGAFWRLVALHEALPKAESLAGHRAHIVNDLSTLDDRSLVENEQLLMAKGQLTLAKRQLAEIRLDIDRQREILLTALHVSPCGQFRPIGCLIPFPPYCLDSCKLEAAALVNRPETFQADLAVCSSLEENKAAIVKLFPRAEGFIGYYRDENQFQLERNWTDGGLRLTFDLMEFAANLLEKQASKGKVFKSDRERAVLSMSILTQVKLKTLDAMKAISETRKTEEICRQAREALRIAGEQERAQDRLAPRRIMRIEREKALSDLLQSEITHLRAIGEVHAALADLDAAVGTNYPVSQAFPHPTPGPGPMVKHGVQTAVDKAFGLVRRVIRW
ncbi:MAG: TolC family protein [Thermodesulfobacteriota bacterium]